MGVGVGVGMGVLCVCVCVWGKIKPKSRIPGTTISCLINVDLTCKSGNASDRADRGREGEREQRER